MRVSRLPDAEVNFDALSDAVCQTSKSILAQRKMQIQFHLRESLPGEQRRRAHGEKK